MSAPHPFPRYAFFAASPLLISDPFPIFSPLSALIFVVCRRFGGVKLSGFGREGSKYGIEEYQTVKMVTMGGMGQPLEGSA